MAYKRGHSVGDSCSREQQRVTRSIVPCRPVGAIATELALFSGALHGVAWAHIHRIAAKHSQEGRDLLQMALALIAERTNLAPQEHDAIAM